MTARPPQHLVDVCDWCLSTPPRHERCHRIYAGRWRTKTGETLDENGATVPVYDGPLWIDCQCDCRLQRSLW